MKERVRDYKPRDTRRRNDGSNKRRGGGIADEFETLLSMRDQPVPDLKDDGERVAASNEATSQKDNDKGIER